MSVPSSQGNESDIILLYTALIADAANTSTRRQTVSNIYLGINGLFLTAMGFLFITSRLNSWWVVGATAAITIAVTPLNRSWLQTLGYYEQLLNGRYTLMREIEVQHRFSERLFGTTDSPAGEARLAGQAVALNAPLAYARAIPDRLTPDRLSSGLATSSTLEKSLPRYFLWLYPILAVGIAVLVLLISTGVLSPITF
jgi:hypothetical protein